MARDAANVLSGVPPIRLLALERNEIWVEEEEYRLRQGHWPEEERNIIRAKARETLFKRWQEEWDSSKDGRWSHKLIPKIKGVDTPRTRLDGIPPHALAMGALAGI